MDSLVDEMESYVSLEAHGDENNYDGESDDDDDGD